MHMKQWSRHRPSTYHDVGWSFPDESPSSFCELSLPDANIRLIDRRVHTRALNEAGKKLDELLRRVRRQTFQ
jgi:hypothetical protein